MSKVMIVTDSTSDLPAELLKDLPVATLPLQVIWGNRTYLDGIDIHTQDFYKRLATEKVMPSTSQVTPEAFKTVYADLLEKGYDILSIHISGKLSGTLDSAIQAKSAFPGAKIELVDSNSTSLAMGFQVISAARMASINASIEECKTVAEKASHQTGVYFVLKTLEFLHRGGRIGGAQAFLGTMLNFKPLLEIRDGRIEAVERVRTMNKVIDRMLDLVEQKLQTETGPIRLGVVHADAASDAEQLLERARKRFTQTIVTETIISTVGPVLGTHSGPGALGLAYMAGM